MGAADDELEDKVRELLYVTLPARRPLSKELDTIGAALGDLHISLQRLRNVTPADPGHDFIVSQIGVGLHSFLQQLRHDLDTVASDPPNPATSQLVPCNVIQDVVQPLRYFSYSFNTLAVAISDDGVTKPDNLGDAYRSAAASTSPITPINQLLDRLLACDLRRPSAACPSLTESSLLDVDESWDQNVGKQIRDRLTSEVATSVSDGVQEEAGMYSKIRHTMYWLSKVQSAPLNDIAIGAGGKHITSREQLYTACQHQKGGHTIFDPSHTASCKPSRIFLDSLKPAILLKGIWGSNTFLLQRDELQNLVFLLEKACLAVLQDFDRNPRQMPSLADVFDYGDFEVSVVHCSLVPDPSTGFVSMGVPARLQLASETLVRGNTIRADLLATEATSTNRFVDSTDVYNTSSQKASRPQSHQVIRSSPHTTESRAWVYSGPSPCFQRSLAAEQGAVSIDTVPRGLSIQAGAYRSDPPILNGYTLPDKASASVVNQYGSLSLGMSLDGMIASALPRRPVFASTEPPRAMDQFPEVVEHVDGPPEMERLPSDSSIASLPNLPTMPGPTSPNRAHEATVFGQEGLHVASAEQGSLLQHIEDAHAIDDEEELFNREGKAVNGRQPGFLQNVMTSNRKSESGAHIYEQSKIRIFKSGSHLRIVTERQSSGMIETSVHPLATEVVASYAFTDDLADGYELYLRHNGRAHGLRYRFPRPLSSDLELYGFQGALMGMVFDGDYNTRSVKLRSKSSSQPKEFSYPRIHFWTEASNGSNSPLQRASSSVSSGSLDLSIDKIDDLVGSLDCSKLFLYAGNGTIYVLIVSGDVILQKAGGISLSKKHHRSWLITPNKRRGHGSLRLRVLHFMDGGRGAAGIPLDQRDMRFLDQQKPSFSDFQSVELEFCDDNSHRDFKYQFGKLQQSWENRRAKYGQFLEKQRDRRIVTQSNIEFG